MSNDARRYFILGATGGIGRVLCQHLRETGAELGLAARSANPLEAFASELGARAFPLDATDREAVSESVDTFAADGPIDGIVNCAGSVLLKPAHRTSSEEWEHTIAANLTTAFHTLAAGTKAMMKTGGSIVLMSSAAARHGLANHEAIAAAKAGVSGLARAAAASYAKRGIRVNTVAPGLVETPLTAAITASDAMRKASEAMHAAGRIGQPGDVARMIAWLLAPENTWVTGQEFGVDGGLATLLPR